MTSNIRPYKIDVPDAAIEKLKGKLAVSEVSDEVEFSNDWAYGTPRNDVLRLAKHWQDGFDWRAQEARLNGTLPQFQTTLNIEGFGELNIHFVHKKSTRAGSIPLLFCHGWPGVFMEVAKILPRLTEENDGPSFHVVAPSLPNFGFSDGVKKRGFGIPQYAETCHKLMQALGYDKYVTQAGDWGYLISRMIGTLYSKHCLASHFNMFRGKKPTLTQNPILYLQDKFFPNANYNEEFRKRSEWFKKEGMGYHLEQSTRPSTVGFALTDPMALLAWVYEKLHDWTDSYPWTDDEILTWVSIYHFSTAGAAASVRIYYEHMHSQVEKTNKAHDYLPNVLMGISYFPKDVYIPPKTWGRTMGPVVFEKEHPSGGHFAAHERPEELANDLRSMFERGAKRVTSYFAAENGAGKQSHSTTGSRL